jgi:hypothetical protein
MQATAAADTVVVVDKAGRLATRAAAMATCPVTAPKDRSATTVSRWDLNTFAYN